MNNKRSFTIEFNGEQFARLVSRTPKGAAQKAVSRLARKYDENGALAGYNANDWNEFSLVETTRGSKKRTYEYKGMRKTLETPIETQVAGKTIICKYDSDVRRVKKEQADTTDATNANSVKETPKKVTKKVTKKATTKSSSKKAETKKATKKVTKKKSTKKTAAKTAPKTVPKTGTKTATTKVTPTSDAKVISTAPKAPKRAKKSPSKSAPKSK